MYQNSSNLYGPQPSHTKNPSPAPNPKESKARVVTDHTEFMSPINPNTIHNLSQFDPSKYGWTIGGGMADVLPPLEVSTD